MVVGGGDVELLALGFEGNSRLDFSLGQGGLFTIGCRSL